ncbi:hypothetical protein M514_07638 [Trichuris suis]|uniref:Uncharacterized protein n=1 Tax=Trichuris suis TaxID=68888 RepID=A0A085M2H9_9BILA|nr:hypothetical protein M513_07638 [Trichuris suis]KFD65752.1 hypothetical protein M514_07638 [Trichuris suis]
MHCICRQGVYETYNKRKHLISYVSKPLGNPVKEACSRLDAERVQRCASNFTILLESEMQLNQHLATTPEIASFLIPYDRLSHTCQTEQATRDCIPMGPWHRCAEAMPAVRHADAIFRVICQRLSDRMRSFESHYMCTRNVLSAHADSAYCLDSFRHEVRYRSVNSSFVRRAMRIQRCNALESFVACVKKPLSEKCSVESAQLWQDAFVSVGSVIAPECIYRQGHFAAREYRTDGFSSPLQIFFPVQ